MSERIWKRLAAWEVFSLAAVCFALGFTVAGCDKSVQREPPKTSRAEKPDPTERERAPRPSPEPGTAGGDVQRAGGAQEPAAAGQPAEPVLNADGSDACAVSCVEQLGPENPAVERCAASCQTCVPACVRRNMARAVSAEQIDSDCVKECVAPPTAVP